MRVYTLPPDPELYRRHIIDLETLLDQPGYNEVRPCLNCMTPCPCSDSVSCTCRCGPQCREAPVMLSSEGDKYPIEGKIVGLVFGINALRISPPFWSCEGHEFQDGSIRRIPQVWFYSRSLIYPRIFSELLDGLYSKKRIVNPWHICLAYSKNDIDTSFSMEPNVKNITNPSLKSMQQDAKNISEDLIHGIREIAIKYLEKYNYIKTQ